MGKIDCGLGFHTRARDKQVFEVLNWTTDVRCWGCLATLPVSGIESHACDEWWTPEPTEQEIDAAQQAIDAGAGERIKRLFMEKLEAAEGPDHPWVKRWREQR